MIRTLHILLCAFPCFVITLPVFAQWTWIGGSDLPSGTASYGTQGVFDPSVTPHAIYAPGQCVDHDGRLWIFGGTLGGTSNDLWCFDPAIEQWAWMSGGQLIDQAGHYGTKGVAAPDNRPHARGYCAAMWCDQNGDLWLFGGLAGSDEMNDLWRYEITSGLWTWMHGDSTVLSTGSYGIIGVSDPSNEPPCRFETIGTWVADDGTLWMFGGERMPFYTYNDMWRYDPVTDEWTWMHGTAGAPGGAVSFGTLNVPSPSNTPGKRCAWTHWKDGNGKFWLFGGMTHGVNLPSSDIWMFDPLTAQWTWKGGPTALADAGAFGTQCLSGGGANPPALLEATANWMDDAGRFYFHGGGYRSGTSSTETHEEIWRYDPFTSEWTWLWGSGLPDPLTVHGTLGVASPTNTPGGRMGEAAVTRGDSLVYIFGGFEGSIPQVRNDLWRLDLQQLCISTPVSDGPTAQPHIWYEPAEGRLHIDNAPWIQRIEAYDVAGRRCLHIERPPTGANARMVDASALYPGVYVLSVSSGDRRACSKFIIR